MSYKAERDRSTPSARALHECIAQNEHSLAVLATLLRASGSLDAIAEPLNPAEITRRINRIQQQLIASAKARTQAGRTAA